MDQHTLSDAGAAQKSLVGGRWFFCGMLLLWGCGVPAGRKPTPAPSLLTVELWPDASPAGSPGTVTGGCVGRTACPLRLPYTIPAGAGKRRGPHQQ